MQEAADRHLYLEDADERCPYCYEWFEAGASCGSASRATECSHMDPCDREQLVRDLDAEYDDQDD